MLFIHKTKRYFEAFECHIKKDELNIISYKTVGYVFESQIKKLNFFFFQNAYTYWNKAYISE